MIYFRNTSWRSWLWKVSLGWKKVRILYRPPSWYIRSYFELDDASRAIRNRFNIYLTGNWTVVCRGFSHWYNICHITPLSKTWSYTNWYILEWNFILSAWVSTNILKLRELYTILSVESIREFLQIEGLLFEEEEAIDCSTLRARLWNLFEYPES